MVKGIAYFELVVDQIAEWMHLPDDARIVSIEQTSDDAMKGLARVYVQHRKLPKVRMDEPIPRCVPVIKRDGPGGDWYLETWQDRDYLI